VSLLVFGGFGGACFLARSLWLLIGFRFLQGLGMSGILGFGIVLVGDYFRGPGRTRAMGANQTGMMVGAMSGPVLSGVLAAGGAFRPFLVYLLAIPLALWAARLPAEPPGTAATPLSHLRDTIDLLRAQSALRDYLGLMVVTVTVISVGIGMGLTVVPLFLDAEFGLPVTWRGVVVAAFQGGTAVAAASITLVRRHLGVAASITVGLGALGAGYALMSAAQHPATVAAGLLCAGLGFGVFIPLAQTYVSSVGGSSARGMTVGMWMSANRVAQTGAPPLAAGLADRAGHRLALLVGSGALLAVAALWHPVRRRAEPPRGE
jgi:MFS family permease